MSFLMIVGKIFAGFCISMVGMAMGLGLCYFFMKWEWIKLHSEDIGGGLSYMLGFGVSGFIISAILSYFALRS